MDNIPAATGSMLQFDVAVGVLILLLDKNRRSVGDGSMQSLVKISYARLYVRKKKRSALPGSLQSTVLLFLDCHCRTARQISDKLSIPKDIAVVALVGWCAKSSNTRYADVVSPKNSSAGEAICGTVDVSLVQESFSLVGSSAEQTRLELGNVDLPTVVFVEGGKRVEKFLFRRQTDKDICQLVQILWEVKLLGLAWWEELR